MSSSDLFRTSGGRQESSETETPRFRRLVTNAEPDLQSSAGVRIAGVALKDERKSNTEQDDRVSSSELKRKEIELDAAMTLLRSYQSEAGLARSLQLSLEEEKKKNEKLELAVRKLEKSNPFPHEKETLLIIEQPASHSPPPPPTFDMDLLVNRIKSLEDDNNRLTIANFELKTKMNFNSTLGKDLQLLKSENISLRNELSQLRSSGDHRNASSEENKRLKEENENLKNALNANHQSFVEENQKLIFEINKLHRLLESTKMKPETLLNFSFEDKQKLIQEIDRLHRELELIRRNPETNTNLFLEENKILNKEIAGLRQEIESLKRNSPIASEAPTNPVDKVKNSVKIYKLFKKRKEEGEEVDGEPVDNSAGVVKLAYVPLPKKSFIKRMEDWFW